MLRPPVDSERIGSLGAARVRYRVVGLTVLLAMVTYFDRSCISVLTPQIRADLSISETQMSYVFSAFAVAYAAFEIPTACWADRIGTRSVLTRIVLWWSGFTVSTGGAFNYLSLLIVRFLFGMGEAGAWPSATRTFSRWIPQRERGTVQGIFFTGAHLAGGLTPLLVMTIVPFLGWRGVFVLFGSVGLVWAAVWYAWFRDDPAEHLAVSAAELAEINTGRTLGDSSHGDWQSWKQLLGTWRLIPLCLMYFPNSYAFYFCLTWMPTYLGTTPAAQLVDHEAWRREIAVQRLLGFELFRI
jgi:MFS transporter, ACS family, glucarate transporter